MDEGVSMRFQVEARPRVVLAVVDQGVELLLRREGVDSDGERRRAVHRDVAHVLHGVVPGVIGAHNTSPEPRF